MDSEEKAFWDHLETHPEDSTCRLVFADWLQERGDPRAEGLRVLGRLGKRARRWQDATASPEFFEGATGYWIWLSRDENEDATSYSDTLGRPWWLKFSERLSCSYSMEGHQRNPKYWHIPFAECESAAALAWLDLKQEQRDGICKLD